MNHRLNVLLPSSSALPWSLQPPSPTPRPGRRRASSNHFKRAVEGIEVTPDEQEMLRRAPMIPIDDTGAEVLDTCLDPLDEMERAGSFSAAVSKRLEPCYALPSDSVAAAGEGEGDDPDADNLLVMQKADMFALGCILGELYLGTPLLSVQDVNSGREPGQCLPEEILFLPYPIRSLICWLLQKDPRLRPLSRDLLNLDGQRRWAEQKPGWESPKRAPAPVSRDPRFDQFSRACEHVFPKYFEDMYAYLEAIYTHRGDPYDGIQFTLTLTRQLVELPLPAFTIVLPYILQALDDPAPYEERERRQQEMSSEKPETPVILQLNPFLDLVCKKLGPRHTQRLVFPRLAAFIEKIKDRRLIRALCVSPLWPTLIKRGGTVGFVTHFLKILLRMVRSNMDSEIQQAAYVALFNLGSPEALGPGLVSRFVVPPLMERIGSLKTFDTEKGAGTALPESAIYDLYEARALINICKEIEDDILVSLVAERIMSDVLPSLERHFHDPQDPVCLALCECLIVLEGFLPALLPETVIRRYCQHPTLTLQQLLLCIPLPLAPRTSLDRPLPPGRAPVLKPNSFRHRLHLQLCRVMAAVCGYIGPEPTKELLLPAIDKFLGQFSDVYEELDDAEPTSTAYMWRKAAFEIVEDLWRQLDTMFDEVDQRHYIPNASKIVIPWWQKEKKENPAWVNGRDEERSASSNRARDKRHEKERLADLLIDKGISGLRWIANRGRRPFGKNEAPGPPSSAHHQQAYIREVHVGGRPFADEQDHDRGGGAEVGPFLSDQKVHDSAELMVS
jgi:hypothetical protein